MFQKCRAFQVPIILYIENLDGYLYFILFIIRIISSIHASPNELMKRRVVEKELCKQLSQLTPTDKFVDTSISYIQCDSHHEFGSSLCFKE